MEVVFESKECPDCKVDARLMNSIVRMEIIKGNMSKDMVGSSQVRILTDIDPLNPPIVGGRVPSARTFYDVCMKCGKERIWRIEKGYVTIPTRPGVPPVFA